MRTIVINEIEIVVVTLVHNREDEKKNLKEEPPVFQRKKKQFKDREYQALGLTPHP